MLSPIFIIIALLISAISSQLESKLAKTDTFRIGKHYIPINIKETHKNKQIFVNKRKAKQILTGIYYDLKDGKNIIINIKGIKGIKATGYPKHGKFRKSLHIELIKGKYILIVKHELGGNLYTQVDFSLPKFREGKKIAVNINNEKWDINKELTIAIRFIEDKLQKLYRKFDIPESSFNQWDLKRIDIFKDIIHHTKAEQKQFIHEIGAQDDPPGYSINVQKNYETVYVKPNDQNKDYFPKETVYDKQKQANDEFGIVLMKHDTRDEINFNKIQIENNMVLRTIAINGDRVFNKFTRKEIDLNKVSNEQHNRFNQLKDFIMPVSTPKEDKIDRIKYNKNEEIYYELIRSAYHSENGFTVEYIQDFFDDLGKSALYNRIGELVKAGVLKRVGRRTFITPKGRRYFELECEIKRGDL